MKICVQWPRLGPYHLARLRATYAAGQEAGWSLTALETASRDRYDWQEERGDEPFERVTLFGDRVFESLSSAEIERAVWEALDRENPDAVAINSYSFPDARACLRWCVRRKRVAVLMTSSRQEDAPRTPWRERLKRAIVRGYDAAIVSGSAQRRYLAALDFPPACVFETCAVVDNGYFEQRAAAARTDTPHDLPGLSDERPFFLASARFIERKDLPTLIRGYALYAERAKAPWRLVLLGDGELRADLEAEAAEVEGVTLAGFQQRRDLPAYYGSAKAFVHPAIVDQWGLVVNEAMAAGLPVAVSTGAGCSEDLVRPGGNGYTFPPRDPERLAEVLGRLSSEETDLEAFGALSRQIVSAYGPDAFALGLLQAARCGAPTRFRKRLLTRVALRAVSLISRRPTSFHAVSG